MAVKMIFKTNKEKERPYKITDQRDSPREIEDLDVVPCNTQADQSQSFTSSLMTSHCNKEFLVWI